MKKLLVLIALATILSPFSEAAMAKKKKLAPFFHVDVKGTYLFHVEEDPAHIPTALSISELGAGPGDRVFLRETGGFTLVGSGPELTNNRMIGVFVDGTGEKIPPGPGTTAPSIVTSVTFYGQLPTDIPEDFLITQNTVAVTVPFGAVALLLGVDDSRYSDNADLDGDYRLELRSDSLSAAAAPITVKAGQSGATQIIATSETSGIAFGYSLSIAPQFGIAVVSSSGLVTYTASGDFIGRDTFEATVISSSGSTVTVPLVATVAPDACQTALTLSKKHSRPLALRDSAGQTCGVDPVDNGINTKCVGQDCVGQPVNVSTGAVWHETRDFLIPGRTAETALRMDRMYVAHAAAPAGALGPNWRHNWETRLLVSAVGGSSASVVWVDENGGPWTFFQENGSFMSPPGQKVSLAKFSDHYELKKANQTILFFSLEGKLQKIKERHGEMAELTYGTDGSLASVSAPMAGMLNFSYANGRLASITRTRDSLTYSYEYDSAGRLNKVTDFDGKSYTYGYVSGQAGTAAQGMLESIVDPLNRAMFFSYYDNGRAFQQKEPLGAVRTFTYDYQTPSTVVKDIDGTHIAYTFDANFHTVKQENLDTHFTIRKTWNAAGLLESVTDELGFITTYGYDQNRNISSIKRPGDAAATAIVYDGVFNVPNLITPVTGSATEFGIDPVTGDILSQKRTLNGVELSLTFTRDAFGNLLSTNNGRSTYADQRNANGQVSVAFDLHNPDTRTYDSRSRLETRTFQSGRVLAYNYDDFDRVTLITDSAGPEQAFQYDAMGRLIKKTVSDGASSQVTSYVWDEHDRLASETDATGRTTTYFYETSRILRTPKSIRDPAGRFTKFEYDVLGRMTKKTDPRGAVTIFSYDKRNDLLSVTDANGNVTSYTYDANRRKKSETRPSVQGTTAVSQTTNYSYDGNDQVTAIGRDPATPGFSRTVLFEYDDLGRLKAKHLNNLGTLNDAVFTYENQLDAVLLKTVNNENVNLSFSSEAAPPFKIAGFSQASAVSGNAHGIIEDSFTVGRDVTGEIASVVGANAGQVYVKGYDAAGRLTAVDAGALKTAIQYDGYGRRQNLAHSTGATQEIGYDLLNRIRAINWRENGKDSFKQRLQYDVAGNIVRLARENARYELTYDETDQLIGSKHRALAGVPDYNRQFTYDLLGNRVSEPSQNQNQIKSNFLLYNETSSFEADQFGYGQVAKERSGNKVKNYFYRADGRIERFEDNEDLRVFYLYDGLDRLVAKLIDQKGSKYTNTFLNLADESRVLLGKAGDGSVTAYVDGQGAAERLGEAKGSAGKGYVTDHLGSVLNSEIAGSSKTFGLFGEEAARVAISPMSPAAIFGFTGHTVDIESGLSRTKYRFYQPKIGRWLSQEPYGQDGPSQYWYTRNNPVRYADFDGRSPTLVTAGVGAVVGAGTAALSTYLAGGDANQIRNAALIGGASGFVAGLVPISLGIRAVVAANALIGAATDVIYQTVVQDRSLNQISYSTALVSGAVGAGGALLGEVVATRALFSEDIVGNSLRQTSVLQAELRGVAAGGGVRLSRWSAWFGGECLQIVKNWPR